MHNLTHPAWLARYTGITKPQIDGKTVDKEEAKLFVKKGQTMEWQVDHFKHIVSPQLRVRSTNTAAFLRG